jgi:uncharacterized Zn finger protein (UPF0148 family)
MSAGGEILPAQQSTYLGGLEKMFCRNCGTQLQEGSIFCPMCGTRNEEPAGGESTSAEGVSAGSADAESTSAEGVSAGSADAESISAEGADAGSTSAESANAGDINAESADAGSTDSGNTQAANAAAENVFADNANAAEGAAGQKDNQAAKVKKIGIIAAVVAVLVILVVVVSSTGSSAGLKIDKNAVAYAGNSYFMDENGNAKEMDDLSSVYTSMNRSTVLYTDYSGDLYILDDNLKAEKIASDVTTVYVGREGKYVVYLSNEDNDYYNQVLCIYDVSKNKSREVDTDVYGDYLTISASGESVAYAKNYENGDFDTYIAGYAGSAKKIDSKSRRAVAVSDNGKKAYLLGSGDLYYYNGKESEKVEKDVNSSFWTNSDLSELVFTKNGSTYFCRPGKDPEKIDNSIIYEVIYPDSYGTGILGSSTQALGNDTIKGQVVYNSDGKLLWVNKKASDMVKIDSNVYDAKMSSDGSAVVYVSNNKIYKVSKFGESMEPKLLYEDEDIYSLAASDDLKKIYGYSYEDDTLYYIKSSKKAEKICDDVDSFAYNSKDGKLYFVTDEELYEAKTSSSSRKKVSVDGDAVSVSAALNGVTVYTRDDGDYICYLIGKNLVKVY